jgi:dATP pyrophosphohydrolase
MARAPFQVLVLPYRILASGAIVYAVFQRQPTDGGFWQGIAGGGEDDETPLEAARREAWEEAGIPPGSLYLTLDSRATVPVVGIQGFLWGDDVLVVPEYTFGVEAPSGELRLSTEHTRVAWLAYDDARSLLKWDSNRNALWELDHRLRRQFGAR